MTITAASTPGLLDNQALRQEILEWLCRHEAANSIQVSMLVPGASLPEDTSVVIARDGATLLGYANLTPPFNVLVAEGTDSRAVDALVDAFLDRADDVPGMMGPPDLAESFAGSWCARTGATWSVLRPQRMLAVTELKIPEGVEGTVRLASQDDFAMLREWCIAFVIEAEDADDGVAARQGSQMARQAIDHAETFLWLNESGEPVSIACAKSPTVNGIRIGPVYTPPEHRGHGYASAVTAAATKAQLDAGYDFVCLYTDARNPTSNKIYEAIGYRFVTDSVVISFSKGAA